jgi:quinol monooxygenase YgiN
MEKFTICVIYKAKEKGAREAFLCELNQNGIVDLIRAEDGCLTYDYYFSAQDDLTLVLFEEWQNRDCQKVHMTQPHMKTAMEIKSKYIDSVELKELTIK